jgi:hypothetical protein
MKKVLAALSIAALAIFAAAPAAGFPKSAAAAPVLDWGGAARTVWSLPVGSSIGAAEPKVAGVLDVLVVKNRLGVFIEATPANEAAAGLFFGPVLDEWIMPALGFDSRAVFDKGGIGPSASVSFFKSISDVTVLRVEIRGTYYGPDREAGGWDVSMSVGGLSPFKTD